MNSETKSNLSLYPVKRSIETSNTDFNNKRIKLEPSSIANKSVKNPKFISATMSISHEPIESV